MFESLYGVSPANMQQYLSTKKTGVGHFNLRMDPLAEKQRWSFDKVAPGVQKIYLPFGNAPSNLVVTYG